MAEKTPSSAGARHVSTRAMHPDVREVLPRFVARMPGEVEKLRQFYAAGDAAGLRGVLHQLKGSGASYGFAPISEDAQVLGELLEQGRSLDQLQPLLEKLIGYIEHIEGYPRG